MAEDETKKPEDSAEPEESTESAASESESDSDSDSVSASESDSDSHSDSESETESEPDPEPASATPSEPPKKPVSEPPKKSVPPKKISSRPPPARAAADADDDDDEPSRVPALYLAEFDSTADILHAAEKVRDAGYEKWDVHTPFPVHGMDAAMGLGQSRLGPIVFTAGLLGFLGAFTMMMWMNGIDYPLLIGGKPPESIPSMVPILFECTVLLSGITAVFGMLGLNKLPRHHHPVFYSERFERGSDDKFFISIEAGDAKFDLDKTRVLLESLHPAHVELVEEVVP